MDDYPNHTVALAVVRHAREQADGNRPPPIYSIGAFACQRINEEEARFTETHVAYDRDTPHELPLAHVKSLLQRDSHVIGCASTERPRRSRPLLRVNDILPGTADLPQGRRHIVRASDERLSTLAWQYDLELNHEDTAILQQARSAARRAQAAWLTSVFFLDDLPTKSALLTAYRAWRVIQNVMPIKF